MSFKKRVPSVNALMTLEAAMRLESFTAAACELNVTQAAVSRQIKLLEEDFGIPLFQRGHHRVTPTLAGKALGTSVNRALELLSETVETLRQPRTAGTLTVGATLAFSYFWLLPRLSSFREERPDLNIRVVSQDQPFNFGAGEPDIVIRFGSPPFGDGEVLATRQDTVVPVCSRGFAADLPADLAPWDVVSLPLIGTDAPEPSWMLWPDWFDAAGVSHRNPRVALQFNHYTDGIAAAIAGQGIALGWSFILSDPIGKGQLVPLTGRAVLGQAPYNVVIPKGRAPSDAAQAFARWIGLLFDEQPEHP